ncbi:MAG: hypothetical protein PHT02_01110 [Tissierellia bacterium]|nr:hypothetical protein [Tissierellia bacterium]
MSEQIKKEKYVVEVGVKSLKYLAESASNYYLTDNIDHAIKTADEEANSYFGVPCLKNKNPRIRKVIISYKLI